MKAIKHYPLVIEPKQVLEIPFNSDILWLGLVAGKPTLAVLTDNAYSPLQRTFHIYAQDKEVSPRLNRTNYIGSFEAEAEVGRRILHVFEE